MKPAASSVSSSKDKPGTSRPYGLEALALAALSGGMGDNNHINSTKNAGSNSNNDNKNIKNSNGDNIDSHSYKDEPAPTGPASLSKSSSMSASSLSTPKAVPNYLSRMASNPAVAPSPNQSSQIPQAILQQLLQEPSILSLLSRLEQQQPNPNGSPSGPLAPNTPSFSSSLNAATFTPSLLSNGLSIEPVMTRSGRPSRPPQQPLPMLHNLSHVDDQLAALHQAWAGLDTSFLDGIAGSLNISNSLPSSGPASAYPHADPFTSSASLLETPTSATNVTGLINTPSANLDLDWWWPFQDEENEDEDPSYDPSTAYPDLTPPTFNLNTPGPSTSSSLTGGVSQPAASTSGSMERLLNNEFRTSSKRKGKGKMSLERPSETSITDANISMDAANSESMESISIHPSPRNGDAVAVSSTQEEEEKEEDHDDEEPGVLSMPGGRLLRKRKVKEKPPPPPPKRVKLTAEESAARRKARNKELASNSRKRQRDYVVGLEARILQLEAEVKRYKYQASQAARSGKAGPGKNIYDVVSGGIKSPHPFANLPSIPASIPQKAPPSKKKSSEKNHPPEDEEDEEQEEEALADVTDEEEDEEWQSQAEGERGGNYPDGNEEKYDEHVGGRLEERQSGPPEVSKTGIGLSERSVEGTQIEENQHEGHANEGDDDEENDDDEEDDDEDDSDSEDSSMEDEDDEDLYQPIIDVPIPVELSTLLPDPSTETKPGGSPRPTDAPDSVPTGDKVGNKEIMDLLKKLLAKMGGAA